ncbi:MAG: sialate O-acetylesterase [Gemmataceae bacterium]
MLRLFFAIILLSVSASPSFGESEKQGPIRVFILAGQSNMEGQAVVDLDHPKYYNGGKGTLQYLLRDPKKAKRFRHLQTKDGKWVVRDDVFIRFRTKRGVRKGGLSIGFTSYPGKHHFGPELQFGHVVGNHFQEPVVLIKTAWGGKSLFQDFSPPSSGGKVGAFYTKMVNEIHEALTTLGQDFPQLKGRQYELTGFVWFQGWNDMFNTKARAEYESNLAHLISDIRKELKRPHLPSVIGELGNGGPKASKNMLDIRRAQAAVARRTEFKGSVAFVETSSFARPAKESPNVGHGHHWFGNAESYFLIGDALGRGMVRLLKTAK